MEDKEQVTTEEHDVTPKMGELEESLIRNAKQIKADRAEQIAEDSELAYGRKIEDLKRDVKRVQRKRRTMLDMSPDNTYSFIRVDAFDAEAFADADMKLGLELRELEIKLEVAESSYSRLFGKKFQ